MMICRDLRTAIALFILPGFLTAISAAQSADAQTKSATAQSKQQNASVMPFLYLNNIMRMTFFQNRKESLQDDWQKSSSNCWRRLTSEQSRSGK